LAGSDVKMKPEVSAVDARLSPPRDPGTSLQLLVALDPWYRVLLGNFRDLFSARDSPAPPMSSSGTAFWPDVFVGSRLPWRGFAKSAMLHGLSILAVYEMAGLGPQRLYRVAPVVFSSSDVLRYELSEYLPNLASGVQSNAPAASGAPANAAQSIISVPPNSANDRQTVVTPPALEWKRDTPLPNIVAWAQPDPRIPAAATAARVSELRLAQLPPSAVAPPPEVARSTAEPLPVLSQAVVAPAPEIHATLRTSDIPTAPPAIVAPPPAIEMPSLDRWHDINIARAQVVSPAPKLPVDAQRALPGMARASLANSSTTIVPPPPREETAQIANQQGRLIALNVRPAPPGPVEVPNGNRRGAFAAGPEGKANAPGKPDIPIQQAAATAGTTSAFGSVFGRSIAGVPPGLFVGPHGKTESTSPQSEPPEPASTEQGSGDAGLMAKASAPRVVARELSADQQTEVERQVFGARRSYAMTLSVPNLNSAGGSWVMHFSEMQEGEKGGDLVAPMATRAVAPAYPLELMRENVEGTVTLSAVISSEGRVEKVTVLTGTNDRLNEYARSALLAWRFMPALRNGKPVALQAVVRIPFKPMVKTSF
jgi:TonB family protein